MPGQSSRLENAGAGAAAATGRPSRKKIGGNGKWHLKHEMARNLRKNRWEWQMALKHEMARNLTAEGKSGRENLVMIGRQNYIESFQLYARPTTAANWRETLDIAFRT